MSLSDSSVMLTKVLTYATVHKQDAVTHYQLVNSNECSIILLKETLKPRVTVKNFEKLINPTPFQKFSKKSCPSPPPVISHQLTPKRLDRVFRSRSSKTPEPEPLISKRAPMDALEHRHSLPVPKSRFFQEYKRLDNTKMNFKIMNARNQLSAF